MEFCLPVWIVFNLFSACKLWLWCCKGCVPMWSVKMGVVTTHFAALKRIGACAPTQAITPAQKAWLNCFGYQQSLFFLCVFLIAPIMQYEGKSCKDSVVPCPRKLLACVQLYYVVTKNCTTVLCTQCTKCSSIGSCQSTNILCAVLQEAAMWFCNAYYHCTMGTKG